MAAKVIHQNGLRIAVEGCGHGTLHSIYASIEQTCKTKGWDGVDLLIIGGDFQAVRNAYDLNCISMPAKYRAIGDFHEYYSGARKAPYLTLFVGGNHEASNYLWELYYGGWVAPNIYYMGAANVLRLGPLRIAGISGIWKGYNYKKLHHERLPYSQDDIKSIYHVRELDTRKLLQIRTQIDIGVSHDWPRGMEWKGNWKQLFRKKPLFEEDARTGNLGSVAAKNVLDRLRPAYWFSAHLHTKYAATVVHKEVAEMQADGAAPTQQSHGAKSEVVEPASKNEDEIDIDLDLDEDAEVKPAENVALAEVTNVEEIDLGLDMDQPEPGTQDRHIHEPDRMGTVNNSTEIPDSLRAQLPASFTNTTPSRRPTKPPAAPPRDIKNKTTKFLALDKCLPNRDFLQILDAEAISSPPDYSRQGPLRLEYDKEWLAITRVFANEAIVGDSSAAMHQDKGNEHYQPLIEQEEAWVEENLVRSGKMAVPEDFAITAPPYDPSLGQQVEGQPHEYSNPHTKAFCELLQIPNPFHAEEAEREARRAAGPGPEEARPGRGRGGFRGNRGRGGGGGGGRGRGGRGRGRGGSGFNSNRGRGGRW
ncbi:DBR1-domain-containing protein [Saccharata proteae CBS 121410]|uniref:DBR1-domain-containing protein n=1 Tax=Saccharata proteae CBS 121410 TaxID=1314787 RepID=A0A9P4HSI2_9PEZI|nr:DBR1-domain-containing protein [Saccharata proteae CBS 121410]